MSELTPEETRRLFDDAMREDEEMRTTKRTPIETLRSKLDLGPEEPLPNTLDA